jgi:hypothetical protein
MSGIVPVYIYFDLKKTKETADTVMACLLKQLAWPAAEEDRTYFREIYEKIKLEDRPSRETIFDLFIQCTRFVEVRVLFDALDECDKSEVGKIYHLIKKLRQSNIGVYITTRTHIAGELQKRFSDSADALYMENIKADDTDVRNTLERRIQEYGESIEPDFMYEIVRKIGNSQGMYGLFDGRELTI